MKLTTKILCVSTLLLGFAEQVMAADYTFRLKNALGFARQNETVEVEIAKDMNLSEMTLNDEDGKTIPFELCGEHGIRFQCSIGKGTAKMYTLCEGTRQQPKKLTYAAIKSPLSRNDIAWENNLCAYRMYSTVLLANEPNTGNGVDLWVKKTPELIVDAMYGVSNYHTESEYGVDAFSVNGKRLGVGGVTHVSGGKLVVHGPHNKCVVNEDGALSSTFTLTYNNLEIDGVAYTKTLTVKTMAGSLLNKATVCYKPVKAGSGKPMTLAVALYQHTDMTSVKVDGVAHIDNPGVAGWAEGKSEGTVTSAGARFFQGCYVPGTKTKTQVIDHHLCVTIDYQPGTELIYYFGGGWNIFPEGIYTSDDDWFDALDRFKESIEHPVVETSWEDDLPEKDDVISILHKVNLYWQQTHPTHGDHFWNRAVYHTGNMEAYKVTGEQQYLDYSLAWAEHNRYWGQTGTDKSKWKSDYGESADYVLFGDNQICFQVYADLYNLLGGEDKIARAREVMEYEMSTDYEGYLWWVDGFYMVLPIMTKLYNITGNQMYLDKMYEYWRWGTDLMWDEDAGLYYRDRHYIYPEHKTNSGKKDFWARGDGWIFAAFARVLDELPENDSHRNEYLKYYRRMAESLAACQRQDDAGNGYWCRSLLDEPYAPGYETSGTALNTYGFAWGINHGILDENRYGLVLQRAWNYLNNIALLGNGMVGYVQPIGSNAAPGTYISEGQTSDFGVGAFLLAAAEMSRYAVGEQSATPMRVVAAAFDDASTIRIKLNQLPDEAELQRECHYQLNGMPIDIASVTHDGEGFIFITLAEPLEYGRYTLTVSGLLSVDGAAMTSEYSSLMVNTVPLYANTTIKRVTAIGAQSGNPASNAIDGKLSTRWSQEGKQQWIQYDLGGVKYVNAVDIAWYLGNTRVNYFDIKCSTDSRTWTEVDMGETTSGLTNEMERYRFNTVQARYVRIYCNGASSSTWNSITEARVCVTDESDGINPITVDTSICSSANIYDLEGRIMHGWQANKIMIYKGKKYLSTSK